MSQSAIPEPNAERPPGFWRRVRDHWRAIRALEVGNLGWRPWNTVRGAGGRVLPAPWVLLEFPEFARYELPPPIDVLVERPSVRGAKFQTLMAHPAGRALIAFGILWLVGGLGSGFLGGLIPLGLASAIQSLAMPFFWLLFIVTLKIYARARAKTVFPRTPRDIVITQNPEALAEIMTARIHPRDLYVAAWAITLPRWQFDGWFWFLVSVVFVAAGPLAFDHIEPRAYVIFINALMVSGTISVLLAGGGTGGVFRFQIVAIEQMHLRKIKFFAHMRWIWRRIKDVLPYAVIAAPHIMFVILLMFAQLGLMAWWLFFAKHSHTEYLGAMIFALALRVLLPWLLRKPFHRLSRYGAQRHLARFEAAYAMLRDYQREAIDEGKPLPGVGPATR